MRPLHFDTARSWISVSLTVTWLVIFSLLYSVRIHAEDMLAADINETIVKVPVSITDSSGRLITRNIIVTEYKPEGNGPFSVAVINHGRDPNDRSIPVRFRYLQQARYLVRRNFVVYVPTRIGYGDTGTKPDPEDAGGCKIGNFSAGLATATEEVKQVIEYAGHQPYSDSSRVLLMGESYGGAVAISASARNLNGVIAAINFAGGAGGNALEHPGEPCQADKMTHLFVNFGAGSKIPTLWIYSENDKFFSSHYARLWFSSFSTAGGFGDLKVLPPFRENGHQLFKFGFSIWRPVVDEFLRQFGVAIPASALPHKPSGYAAINDIDHVPVISVDSKQKGYAKFLEADLPRAFAIGPKGEYVYRSGLNAVNQALDECHLYTKAGCRLYAVDDDIVW